MGKNSLIKSTSKKTAEKDAEEKKKKTTATPKKAAKTASAKAKKAAKKETAKTKSASRGKSKTASKAKATAKKSTASKAKTTTKKTTKAKSGAKKTPKAKAAVQKAPKAKSAAKKPAPAKKKTAAKKQKSAREILFQKFESWEPEKRYSPSDEKAGRDYTAPPWIATDNADEAERMKKLLFLRFSAEALKAAARETAEREKKNRQAEQEKEAARKAADQKAAAEKAAAEQAAREAARPSTKEPEADVSVSYPPPPEKAAPADPMEKAFKYAIAGFAVLLALLIGYSFANTGNYYLDSANGGLKIYQGRFAPIGKELIITLPGVKLAEPPEEVYTRSQVYPLIADFYLDKADALLAAPGLPDYEGIRSYLREALKYATGNDLRNTIYTRLDGIELLTLLYKAEVAVSKDSIESLEEALDYLGAASKLEMDTSQANLIDQKQEAVRSRIEQLRAEQTAAEAETAAPEKK